MARTKIRKKRRPSVQKWLRSLSKAIKAFDEWLENMLDSTAYRDTFWAALWGEMAECEVRLSTIGGFSFFTLIGFGILLCLPTSRYFVKAKFVIAIVSIFAGFKQLENLREPIFWANKFALQAAEESQKRNGVYHPYDRYSEYIRQQTRNNPPIGLEDIRKLCSLYHLMAVDAISEYELLDELKKYSRSDVEYFYKAFRIEPDEPHFPTRSLRRGSSRRGSSSTSTSRRGSSSTTTRHYNRHRP